ncbi:Exodeoxyribonuclease 7 small subunit [compost metagenome]
MFQQGMKLSQLCGSKLEQVERKIEMITVEDGELRKKPFGNPLEGDSDESL